MIIDALSLFAELPAIAVLLLAIACAGAMAGAAILPDIDHRNSTITNAFGPISLLAHHLVLELHYTVASVTADAGNRTPPGAHRGVTHWWPFPPVIGGFVALGCWLNKWIMFTVLIVLFTGAIRALTVPDYRPRPKDSVRHRWSMVTAHGLLDFSPAALVCLGIIGIGGSLLISKWVLFTCVAIVAVVLPVHLLKKARKRFINRTYRVGGYWTYYLVPVGKICTVLLAAGFALMAIRFTYVTEHGAWLGALVCVGMHLHILGDAPTEMGIPGFKLHRFWRLPKWLAFRAGGPFEIVFLWAPMTALGVYLIPGVRPHDEVIMVQWYLMYGLVTLAILSIGVEFGSRYMKRKAWIA